jgi:hypothetical protein
MLSQEENEMLTRVGPGTPCGALMRRYWHPVAPTAQMEDNPVRAANVPWVPTLEGWPAAIIEAAIRTSLPWRQRTTSYRFNFHKVSKAGWKYIEDDVDRYCPDRELILKLYEEANKLMHR